MAPVEEVLVWCEPPAQSLDSLLALLAQVAAQPLGRPDPIIMHEDDHRRYVEWLRSLAESE